MYRTCLHCHASLGTNEVIERFTAGRRLAFDAHRGRLWVVCSKCRRWNLSPLEERWEAIEECERTFAAIRTRVSSDNISLARAQAGLDLIRVGEAKFPELAAWRYGRSLQQRWRTRGIPWAAAGFAGFGAQVLFNAGLVGFGGFFGLIAAATIPAITLSRRLGRVRVMLPDGRMITVKHQKASAVALEPDAEQGWALRLADQRNALRATGTAATHGLRGILTAVNFFGAPATEVRAAVQRLGDAGGSRPFIERVARAGQAHGASNVNLLPPEVRCALEMALHEDVERKALEGELAALREEWKLAEEVARIADDLLVGPEVLASLRRMQGREVQS